MDTDRTDLMEKLLEEMHRVREDVSSLRREVTSLNERMRFVPQYLEVTMITQKEHGQALESLKRRIHLLVGCDSSVPPPVPTPPPSNGGDL